MAVDKHDKATVSFLKPKGKKGRPVSRLGTIKEKNAEDQRKSVESKKAQGMKRVSVWLSAESLAVVDEEIAATGKTREGVINDCLLSKVTK